MNDAKVAVVMGAGTGLGGAIARRFAREGFTVALMARDGDKLVSIQEAIAQTDGIAHSIPCDATEPGSVMEAFDRVRSELGVPEVFAYNAGTFVRGGILELTPEVFDRCWRVNCLGAFLSVQQVLPGMVERGRGTILLTGATASLRGSARFAGLAVGKFGLRALAQSLAREFGSQGIHVAHVIIDGQIDTPPLRTREPQRDAHTLLNPEAIAETYWQLHQQDATAWTLELDLRPATEAF